VDPFSGQPEFKHTPVRVEACQHQSHALVITKQTITSSILEQQPFAYWAKQKVAQGYLYFIESEHSSEALIDSLEALFEDTQAKKYHSPIANHEMTTGLHRKSNVRHAMWVCATIDVALDAALITELFNHEQDETALVTLTQ
jgi:assimilatory nitrate reductase catalytic subunit